MKAMILAAGLGTRLKPLTVKIPKALIPLADKPLIYYLIQKLKRIGVEEIIINVHHHSEMICEYLEKNNKFDIRIEISKENTLLDTGGGLKKAAWFFADNQPFILHNVDVLSSIDLERMMHYHDENNALVTLAVKKRKTSRYFLFDSNDLLVGWQSLKTGVTETRREVSGLIEPLSFLGIHVISPDIFQLLPQKEIFSIVQAYLDLTKKKKRIIAYHSDEDFWLDLGRKENLKPAEDYLVSNKDF